MKHLRRLGLSLIVLALPALSQARLSPAEERLYGGVYSNACDNPNAPRVRLYGDVMTVERSGNAVSAKPFRSSATAPSGTPPPAFRIAFVGEVLGGDGLVFVLTHDARGLFVTLAGGPKSLARVGLGLQGQKLRHCDPNRNALPGTPAARSISPPELLRDPKFKTAYLKALGPLAGEKWLSSLSGPGPEVKTLSVAGIAMQMASVCKPQDCAEHNTVLLFDSAQPAVYGKVYQAGHSTLLGRPPPAVAAALERQWAQEWRRRP